MKSQVRKTAKFAVVQLSLTGHLQSIIHHLSLTPYTQSRALKGIQLWYS